jgi:hypothetical protein
MKVKLRVMGQWIRCQWEERPRWARITLAGLMTCLAMVVTYAAYPLLGEKA